MTRRVGILGGTFDPVHCGHLDVGAAAHAALGLAEILILPSNIPPHRPQPLASSYHRFAMVALAIAGRPGWRVLDLELREAARSYTSDTLQRFHDQAYSAAELFFITGADAFVEIATWKNYPALLDLAHFAVVSRPGAPVGEVPVRLPALAERMREVDGQVRLEPDATYETLIFLIDAHTADVSSTAIRRARAHRESIAGLVTPAVQQHIEQHALYEDSALVAASYTRG
jgi:nicotinate-nucleotide adenylyltransferase